nr:MAG TPA: hypothetical protein [Caudoviricetes sp.]
MVTRYKAFSRFFAARNVSWCGLPPAVGDATLFFDCSRLFRVGWWCPPPGVIGFCC